MKWLPRGSMFIPAAISIFRMVEVARASARGSDVAFVRFERVGPFGGIELISRYLPK